LHPLIPLLNGVRALIALALSALHSTLPSLTGLTEMQI